MSRRSIRKKPASVTLFPFLAVLICTMGALIVLLVVVVQQARHQATAAENADSQTSVVGPPPPAKTPDPHVDQKSKQLVTQLEDLEWRNQQLAASREATRQRLEDQRMELSRLEDQTRTLADQLELLEKQGAGLDRYGRPGTRREPRCRA